jgi:eukaryotic-like serine/threonine-protein kinase
MATVDLAEELTHQRKVAITVLKPDLAAVLGADRFVQEIQTTAQLQHLTSFRCSGQLDQAVA